MINLKTENWEINNIETCLFDKDGTFIDLHYFWGKMTEMRAKAIISHYNLSHKDFFEKLCLYLGYDINSEKMLAEGITALYSRMKIIEIFNANLLNENIQSQKEEIETIFDEVSDEFYKNMIQFTKPIQSAIGFIKALKQKGVKLGIVTSDSIISTNLTLKQFAWEDLFDVVIGRESSTETKESGIPTQMALKKLSANPKTTVMFGDAPMDFISAQNAGIDKTVLISTGQIKKKDLMSVSKYTVEDLSLIRII